MVESPPHLHQRQYNGTYEWFAGPDVSFLQENNDSYWRTRFSCWRALTHLTSCTRFELYYCCLLSHRYTLALLRLMLCNCNLFNYMLLWFFPLALICFSQCMLHVLATRNVFGAISLFMIIDLCTFCKALSCNSLWLKASAKWIHVNVNIMLEIDV